MTKKIGLTDYELMLANLRDWYANLPPPDRMAMDKIIASIPHRRGLGPETALEIAAKFLFFYTSQGETDE